jgi:hypothetical protein
MIHRMYLSSAAKLDSAAQAYDDALAAHRATLKSVSDAQRLATDILVGLFFAGLGGAAGGAVGIAVGKRLGEQLNRTTKGGALIDASKDVTKFAARAAHQYGMLLPDPLAGVSPLGGSGVELARSVGKRLKEEGAALLLELEKLDDLVRDTNCKTDDIVMEGDPTMSLASDPFLKLLGDINADQQTFAKVIWGEWLNQFAYTQMISGTVHDREGNIMEPYDVLVPRVAPDIEQQAGKDFGLEKRLKELRRLRCP